MIPVDTHVHRVATRLGLVPPKVSAERADRLLHDLVPDGLRTPLHVGFDPAGPRDLQGADAAVPALSTEGPVSDRPALPLSRRGYRPREDRSTEEGRTVLPSDAITRPGSGRRAPQRSPGSCSPSS